jgi:SAM-dependent methyltransferase
VTIREPYEPPSFGNFAADLAFIDASGVISPGARVLEIGAGTGRLLHALVQRGVSIEGVELRQDLIDDGLRCYGPLPLKRVTGTSLPYAEASFDAVISFDVFEHIPDSDAHLAEVWRVLRPGGSYLLQTPNKWTNVIFETIRWRSFTCFRSDHCSLHSLGELERRLGRHGFSVEVFDVPVVNEFFRTKVRQYAGAIGLAALAILNPDRWPRSMRTNLFVRARKTA